MSDLIEKSPILSKLTMCIDQSESDWDDGYNTGIAEAMQYVKNAPAVNRWIPCSEKMPVRYDPVMILTDDGSCAIAHMTGNEDEYLWFGDGGHYSKDYVLFWMPLPEPPEKE